ncbi:MAG: hypothetical protein HFF52_05775 [Lawsonibacter sp.]|nr:hypothetical protein [Lawsonibacter sp.]
MRRTRWPELTVRLLLLLAGLTIAHLGVTLFLKSNLGSDPFNVLVQGLYWALPWRLLALVAGCVILAFGMTIVIRSEAGTGPNDLVAVVLSDRLKKPFGPVRVGVDLCFALTGWVLGGVAGVGTVVCAGLVGPCAQVFLPVSGRLCNACLDRIRRG